MNRYTILYWTADDTDGCFDTLTKGCSFGTTWNEAVDNFYKSHPDCTIYDIELIGA